MNIPKIALKTYIGVLVLAMGVILLSRRTFAFSWKRMIGVGILSSFNKGLSGGGFGPVVTAGQIIAGQEHKGAIAATTLAEAPICTVGVFCYLIGGLVRHVDGAILDMPVGKMFATMFSPELFQWPLVLALLLGSVLVAPFGAFATRGDPHGETHRDIGRAGNGPGDLGPVADGRTAADEIERTKEGMGAGPVEATGQAPFFCAGISGNSDRRPPGLSGSQRPGHCPPVPNCRSCRRN